jgi:maleate isomerase
LDLSGVDALVISACVQMPSLPLVDAAEQELGLPVISAATAGAYSILRAAGVPLDVPAAGALLRRDSLIHA